MSIRKVCFIASLSNFYDMMFILKTHLIAFKEICWLHQNCGHDLLKLFPFLFNFFLSLWCFFCGEGEWLWGGMVHRGI